MDLTTGAKTRKKPKELATGVSRTKFSKTKRLKNAIKNKKKRTTHTRNHNLYKHKSTLIQAMNNEYGKKNSNKQKHTKPSRCLMRLFSTLS